MASAHVRDSERKRRFDAAGHFGVASSGVWIAATTIGSAWNVQGPQSAEFTAEAHRALGIELPAVANTVSTGDGRSVLWLGPRSWLAVGGAEAPSGQFEAARGAIEGAGGALFDVSAGRVAWTLRGRHAADVLASGCPLDLHPRAFGARACAQSVFGRVQVLIEKRGEAPTFVLFAARSFGRDLEHALATAAAQYGCDILPPADYGRDRGG
jgi:sarcosine oxidase subunit gamma